MHPLRVAAGKVPTAAPFLTHRPLVSHVPPFASKATFHAAAQRAWSVRLAVTLVVAETLLPPVFAVYHPANTQPLRFAVGSFPMAAPRATSRVPVPQVPPLGLKTIFHVAVQCAWNVRFAVIPVAAEILLPPLFAVYHPAKMKLALTGVGNAPTAWP